MNRNSLILIACSLLLGGCVSASKYKAQESKSQSLAASLEATTKDLAASQDAAKKAADAG
ncbi:MAG: hypothetical protein WC881_09545 [Elusimicrobiota bacterium]|jgi:outer membrane murein-binding lipoprotein Lpp